MFSSITWNNELSVSDFLTAGSIIAAGIAFLVRSWEAQRQEMRQNTFQLLSRIFEPGPVADGRMKMARWIATGREFEDDIVHNEEDEKVILSLIDFYEFVCEGTYRGVIDGQLVNKESGGRMERAYMVVRKYIEKREERLSKLNAEKGLKPVDLYRNLRLFLSKYRGVDTGL